MPTLVQINAVVNYTSTGRIAEGIGKTAIDAGWESFIAFGRHPRTSASSLIDLSDSAGTAIHGFATRIGDRHGLHSNAATKRLTKELDSIKPDVVHLHNLHGYYLNYKILFEYLQATGVQIVWTLHDCWAFTGHCCYFDEASCERWVTGCYQCPLLRNYPTSYIFDRSKKNWLEKKLIITATEKMHFVTPCNWLAKNLAASFLDKYSCAVLYNGVDVDVFSPKQSLQIKETYNFRKKHLVLAVASEWDQRKGLPDIIRMYSYLQSSLFDLAIVGVTHAQAASLPTGITPILRTDNVEQLAELYSSASVFINPTTADNFPTTNLEALACGTPVITYDTGGSPEAIDTSTGMVVQKNNVKELAKAVTEIVKRDYRQMRRDCRRRAKKLFNLQSQHLLYVRLYESLLQQK